MSSAPDPHTSLPAEVVRGAWPFAPRDAHPIRYAWWPDPVRLLEHYRAATSLLEAALFFGAFALVFQIPWVEAITGIPGLWGAVILASHLGLALIAARILPRVPARPGLAFRAFYLWVITYNFGAMVALLSAGGTPNTPVWLGFTLFAALNGAAQELEPSGVFLIGLIVTPFAPLPVFLANGFPLETAIAFPLLVMGFSTMTYVMLAHGSRVWRAERRDLRRRLGEIEHQALARDLHDAVGSTLAVVGMYGDLVAAALDDPPRLRRTVDELRDATREGVDALRGVIDALAPAAGDLSHCADVLDHIAARAADASGARVSVARAGDLARPLDPRVRLALVRVFQESVTNALRHGDADTIAARLEREGGLVRLVVRDDGQGFDPATARPGRGLAGMRERARELGGRLDLDAAPARGTTLTLELPVGGTRA